MNFRERQRQLFDDIKMLERFNTLHFNAYLYWAHKHEHGDSTTVSWKSPNGNVWYIQLICDRADKKDWAHREKGNLLKGCKYFYQNCFTTLDSKCGRYVFKAQSTHGGYLIVTFLPHFFRRYRERMKLGNKPKPLQIVKRFFKKNSTGYSDLLEDGDFEVCFNEGVGLGDYLSFRQRLMKTFVAYDMAYGDQVDRFAKNNELRKQLCENAEPDMSAICSEVKMLGMSDKDVIELIKERIKNR